MNETWAQISDLAFEAALAGYVVALVCYAIEFASRRGGDVPADQVGSAVGARSASAAAGRGATSTLTRPGGPDPAVIGALPARERAPWGERFGRAAVVVTTVGLLANLLSIVARGIATGRLPLGNMYEFTSVICAAAVLCWLVVLARTGARTMGMFVLLPVVVLMFVAGTVLYVPAAPLVPALNSYWKWIHVTTVALSSSVLMVSGAASVLYLLRGRVDRRASDALAVQKPATGTQTGRATDSGAQVDASVPVLSAPARQSVFGRLPSTATLDRIAYRTAIVAFPVYTFAVIAGAMWAEVAWGRYWGWDPKETCAFITWVIYAAYLHARSTAGWRGRRAAWISVVGFASILFNLFFINMVVSGLHSYAGLN
ncbi:c-type cytochrome biogenesis protein CcsB [Nakamurella sp. GG22]